MFFRVVWAGLVVAVNGAEAVAIREKRESETEGSMFVVVPVVELGRGQAWFGLHCHVEESCCHFAVLLFLQFDKIVWCRCVERNWIDDAVDISVGKSVGLAFIPPRINVAYTLLRFLLDSIEKDTKTDLSRLSLVITELSTRGRTCTFTILTKSCEPSPRANHRLSQKTTHANPAVYIRKKNKSREISKEL